MASLQSREKLALAREDSAQLREGFIDLREDAALMREAVMEVREVEAHTRDDVATCRESEIGLLQAAYDADASHRQMLLQANEQLVIATMKAHELAEQVQTAKLQLDHLAYHDILTDLPNRMLLQDRLQQAIEVARRQGSQLAVMFLDLDRFKHINDSLGHAVGDELLVSVAQRLVGCVRQSDTVSRQGGDEFLMLLPDIEHAQQAALFAQKILTALADPHHLGLQDLHISVSVGISVYPDDGQDAVTLIKSADTAMYQAKENGRDNYKFFKPEMNVRAVKRQVLEAGLRMALERQEFVLHYQPKINLRSGAVVGVEALIRWQHPTLGMLLPAEFVPIAEDCGLILPIGRWVLREACQQTQVWLQAGLSPISIAVNISALEFRAKDFVNYIRETLESTGLEACHLELELTESVLMRDAESTHTVLKALSNLGVKLAIDDFGTGYSSLSYLHQFPIDTLKIDQSFLAQMTNNPDDATIISAMISMGRSLHQRVIAEGVETREQFEFLLSQHCDEGQGHYFGHPVLAPVLAQLLKTGVKLPHLPG
jgi:diguanylate cyclase (GGDEF)-like protein